MFDPVGSTSWHNRHLVSFLKLNELLRAEAVTNITVMVVGPGAVTRLASSFLNNAAAENTSQFRKLIGDAARYSDQALRRIPVMPLRSLEPLELTRVLTVPHKLVVVDRSQRVLDAVARDLPEATCRCVDIAFQPISVQADVVVAFNVVCRLGDNSRTGMAHVAEAVLPNGWLLVDDRSARANLSPESPFVRVAPKTFRRQESQ